MRIDYMKTLSIFRPSGIELNFKNGDQSVWKGSIRPMEPNQTFVTYISPLASSKFAKVFGEDPIQSSPWDTLEYRSLPADMLGSTARRIHIEMAQCVNPQRFTE
jgi:hypothetical protein